VRLLASEAAVAVGGVLHGPDTTFDGVSVDSRTVAPGQLFVPIVAARDGHRYIADARGEGAVAYLTAETPAGGTAVRVADTGDALWALGVHARTLLPDRVIGITGSVGKTTVKDLVAGGLATRVRTHANHASFNNELGVPLTLVGAPGDVEAVVVEMGARFPGDIARLCGLVRPTIGVITSIGTAHLEHLGGPDGVRKEKGSLIECLPSTGYAVLPDADLGSDLRARTDATVVTFGTDQGDVRSTVLDLDDDLRPMVRIESPWGSGETILAVRGAHQGLNAAAAVAAVVCAGVDFESALAGVATSEGSRLRAEYWRTPTGLRVLNDSYNANPDSVEAALRTLARVDAPRRVAVLGEMAELGPAGEDAHRRMGALAGSLGIEVVSVGVPAYGGTVVETQEDALALVAALPPDSAVLVKASRSVGLDLLADELRVGTGACR
jgi:UDP-N-acetylmuramoyl-tripeptide--D-alanyl-D-alanine ligase